MDFDELDEMLFFVFKVRNQLRQENKSDVMERELKHSFC